MRLISVFIAFLFLSACASNVQTYSKIDQNAKSITVPAGASGIKGEIKKALAQRGWKLVVYSGSEILEGKAGASVYLERYRKFNTRYTLVGFEKKIDYCLIEYDISVIDNKDGSEVFAIEGFGCEAPAVKAFTDAIEAK